MDMHLHPVLRRKTKCDGLQARYMAGDRTSNLNGVLEKPALRNYGAGERPSNLNVRLDEPALRNYGAGINRTSNLNVSPPKEPALRNYGAREDRTSNLNVLPPQPNQKYTYTSTRPPSPCESLDPVLNQTVMLRGSNYILHPREQLQVVNRLSLISTNPPESTPRPLHRDTYTPAPDLDTECKKVNKVCCVARLVKWAKKIKMRVDGDVVLKAKVLREQGIMFLDRRIVEVNTRVRVRAGRPGGHRGKGWYVGLEVYDKRY